jgi:hypothetical protein
MIPTLNDRTLGDLARWFAVVTAISLLGLASEFVQAAPVTYTIAANGTGSLGDTAFSGSDFVITADADTNNVVPFGGGFLVASSNMNISVAGIGNGDLTNANQSVSNQGGGLAGFGDTVQDFAILFVSNPIFGSYDLKSSFGPIAGSPVFNSGQSFPTTGGFFVLTDVSNPSFTAVVIPEPTTAALALAATFFFVGRRRER